MVKSNGLGLKLIKSDKQLLQELCDWMDANCLQPITWEMLSRRSGLSQRELLTQFTIHFKTTPMTYIRKCKEARQAPAQAANPPPSLKPVKKILSN